MISADRNSSMLEKIHFIIENYKENFERINEEERYKWEAIGWYKKHWNIKADDFAAMLEQALGKTHNLLSSGMYFARKVIVEFAQEHPEDVRALFVMLHDETLLLEERYTAFREKATERLKELQKADPKVKKHDQDLRAIMLYLTFEYPEKYYLFKSTMFDDFSKRVGFVQKKPEKSSVVWKVDNFMQLCEIILEEVKQDEELLKMHKARLDDSCYQDEALHLLVMDIIYYGSNYSDNMDTTVNNKNKNTILYGPPGTGKTYNTAIYAVAICDGEDIETVQDMEYSEVMNRYKELQAQGRIAFTTFHQSYGYEEFIEGIKPRIDNESKDVFYKVVPGIFKDFCEKAESVQVKADTFEVAKDAVVWKATIRNEVAQDCYDNNRVRIDWGMESEGAAGFVQEMKKGDIVIVNDGSRSIINGIAVIESEEAFSLDTRNDATTRNVKWLAKGLQEDVRGINDGKMLHRMTCCRVPSMTVGDILALAVEKNKDLKNTKIEKTNEPHVFIIDEINRGNISKIFGELITLIEDSKRAGMKEEASAILPYSGEKFSVPQNVYLIGTMNTADRSIALMDTALRRRFSFVEMMPDSQILKENGADKVIVNDEVTIDIAEMLDAINTRITYLYDREHTIGHAFFMKLRDNATIEKLAEIFEKSIIPLLQEYFYEDYQKIQLVLGDNAKNDEYKFIQEKETKVKEIFKGAENLDLDLPEYSYTIHKDALMQAESYIQIYK